LDCTEAPLPSLEKLCLRTQNRLYTIHEQTLISQKWLEMPNLFNKMTEFMNITPSR
jgi:hypothetical protein